MDQNESTREKLAEKAAQRSTPRSLRDFRKTFATSCYPVSTISSSRRAAHRRRRDRAGEDLPW
ncbi:hypothetical protein F2Q68_00012905 [Brassica cretica]|uniref:Uncharacterized protein n=1 Tax=Brassica cretica TaxID=69181 RepID=A0A8S9HMB9_BRACR|nr:hypothetical protein F2Q68_00012905 [Brassica cretica]